MKAINRVLQALKDVGGGKKIGSDELAKNAGIKRSVVANALVRKKILPKLKDVLSFEIVDRKAVISLSRNLTDADFALFVKAKVVKVPRIKKEKILGGVRVTKKSVKKDAEDAESQLASVPAGLIVDPAKEMDDFFAPSKAKT